MSKMIIVVAPSGAGKSTFIDQILLCPELPIKDLITYTTREMRPDESEGDPYFFISEEEFLKRKSEDFFVEWAKVHSSYYGSSNEQIRSHWQSGHAVIMDVDIQGAQTFKNKFPEALIVFIQPPSIETLKDRLLKRGGGKLPPDYKLRMESAKREMAWAKNADEVIINDDFEEAFAIFRKKVEFYLGS
jgi:guanylate kinase